jgi:hypothetical protein
VNPIRFRCVVAKYRRLDLRPELAEQGGLVGVWRVSPDIRAVGLSTRRLARLRPRPLVAAALLRRSSCTVRQRHRASSRRPPRTCIVRVRCGHHAVASSIPHASSILPWSAWARLSARGAESAIQWRRSQRTGWTGPAQRSYPSAMGSINPEREARRRGADSDPLRLFERDFLLTACCRRSG